MTLLSKITLFVLLLVGAGALGFMLHSDTATAPTVSEDVQDVEQEVATDTSPPQDAENTNVIAEEEVPSLITRNLSNQGIREVPRSEFERRNTEILDLSGNELVSLQAEIRQLANLRILDLSDNQMTNIPAELGQLSKLEVLDLSNNKLTGLPYELGNLKNLKTLDLRGNSYAQQDLDIIRKGLAGTSILVD